jgi:glycosyltransferase involved in cell wall biosynthesis
MTCLLPGVSVLVPVYNEARTVGQMLRQLIATLDMTGTPYEILVIDDGSTDASLESIQALESPRIQIIRHPVNQGYGASLTAGVRQARYPAMVVIDADGTYPVAAIPALIMALDTHVMAVGARGRAALKVTPLRFLSKQPLRWLAELLTGRAIPDLNSGLRAIRREAILPLLPLLPTRFSWTSTITVALMGSGQPAAFLQISYGQRQGDSKFHPVADSLRAMRCIIVAAAAVRPWRTRLWLGSASVVGLLVAWAGWWWLW